MKKIAVFASGSGKIFKPLSMPSKQEAIDASISSLVCDQPEAYCVKRAEAAKFRPLFYSERIMKIRQRMKKPF